VTDPAKTTFHACKTCSSCTRFALFIGYEAAIEWTPQAYVRESVLDYVQLRMTLVICFIKSNLEVS